MRLLVLGNSGSGKSTLAQHLGDRRSLPVLDLDRIVWEPEVAAQPRDRAAVLADLDRFAGDRSDWIVEGCYGSLAAHLSPRATHLIYLNLSPEACQANNHLRPWEPEKFPSPDAQAEFFDFLQGWIAEYPARTDEFGQQAHRRVYDAFPGTKVEWAQRPAWETVDRWAV